MDDYRKLMLLSDIKQEVLREAQLARRSPGLLAAFSLRRVFVTLTLLLIGMLAWWGR